MIDDIADKRINLKIPDDCALVVGGVNPDDTNHWAKIAIRMRGHNSDPQMTIRAPARFVGDGISVGFDGRQYGRVFARECDFTVKSCEATFNVDPVLQSMLGTKGTLTVEYKVEEKRTAFIEFELANMIEAMGFLGRLADPLFDAFASTAPHANTTTGSAPTCCASDASSNAHETIQFVIERRESPYNYRVTPDQHLWEAPLQKCQRASAMKDVSVKLDVNLQGGDIDFNLADEADLERWLKQSSDCEADSVYWIKIKEPGKVKHKYPSVNPVALASQTIYQMVSKKVATVGIVPEYGKIAATLPAREELSASGQKTGPNFLNRRP